MPDLNLQEAIKEAYATAPTGVVIYHTLEIIHPLFTVPPSLLTSSAGTFSLVQGYKNMFTAAYEDGDPVPFLKEYFNYPFLIQLPGISEKSSPEVSIILDNSDKLVLREIKKTLTSSVPITVIYQPFLGSSRPDTAFGDKAYKEPLTLKITSASVTLSKITLKARFPDLANMKFPKTTYTAERFPGILK